MTRVLVVCLGNICRSPTAEAVLRHLADDDIEIDSAGTGDWHIGKPPYGPAIDAARARGYDLTALRARQVSRRDFYDFDVILAMDEANLADLRAMAPSDATADIRLFLDAAGTEETAVPDPYYTRDFDGALDLIERGARAVLKTL